MVCGAGWAVAAMGSRSIGVASSRQIKKEKIMVAYPLSFVVIGLLMEAMLARCRRDSCRFGIRLRAAIRG